jgi:hypothetical protein
MPIVYNEGLFVVNKTYALAELSQLLVSLSYKIVLLNNESFILKAYSQIFKGHFTLWLKVERPSITTIQIARNQEFDLSTLHTRVQSPKAVAI